MNATYQRPRLTPGQERAAQADLFGFLIKLRLRDLLQVNEAAEILRCSPDYVRDVIALGDLEVLELAAKGPRVRRAYRITVRSFLLYLASRSKLSPEDLDDLLFAFVEKLDPRALDRLLDLINRHRARLTPKRHV